MNTNDLVKLLPAGYEDACYEKKAITRKRTITNPLDLLRLILFYLSGNKSLIDVSQFALMSGIGKISDVGFMKRFLKSKEWIIWLSQHILPNPVLHYKKPRWLESYQVLAVDMIISLYDLLCKIGGNRRLHFLRYDTPHKRHAKFRLCTGSINSLFPVKVFSVDGILYILRKG